MLRFVFSVVGLVCMIYAVYHELLVCPSPQAGFNKGVDKYIGKTVFLTVQSIFILKCYFCLCTVNEGAKLCGFKLIALNKIIYKYSSVAGGFAIFLTIMFYSLCWFNNDFQTQVVQRLEAKGMPFGRWQHWVHFPRYDAFSAHILAADISPCSLPLALLDAVTQERELVHQVPTHSICSGDGQLEYICSAVSSLYRCLAALALSS